MVAPQLRHIASTTIGSSIALTAKDFIQPPPNTTTHNKTTQNTATQNTRTTDITPLNTEHALNSIKRFIDSRIKTLNITSPTKIQATYPEFPSGLNPHKAGELRKALEALKGTPILDSTRGLPTQSANTLTRLKIGLAFTQKLLQGEYTGYTSAGGAPQDREAIAHLINKRLSLSHSIANLTADHVLLTNGGAEAANITFTTLSQLGYNIHLPSPTYALYSRQLNTFSPNAKVFELSATQGITDNYLTRFEQTLKHSPHSKHALVLTIPGNPNGTTPSQTMLNKLAKLQDKYPGLQLIVDLAYADNVEEGKLVKQTHEALNPRKTIYIMSGSKGLGEPGLRGGLIFATPEMISDISKTELTNTLNTHPIAAIAMKAALSLTQKQLENKTQFYLERMQPIHDELQALGVVPKGEKPGPMFVYLTLFKTLIDANTPLPKEAQEALRTLGINTPNDTVQNDVDLAAYIACQYGLMGVPDKHLADNGDVEYGVRFYGAYENLNLRDTLIDRLKDMVTDIQHLPTLNNNTSAIISQVLNSNPLTTKLTTKEMEHLIKIPEAETLNYFNNI